MTLLGLLSYRLEQACLGRESRPDRLSLRLMPIRNHRFRLEWQDTSTGQRGLLGYVTNKEKSELLRTLDYQLRTWRSRCPGATATLAPPRSLAAAGGGR